MSIDGYISDHRVQALARMLQEYKDKEKFEAIVSALADQIQESEDAFDDLFTLRTITAGSGQVLDDIGTIVGQPRLGFTDERYRSLLRAKIGENVSQGDIERIISISKLLIGANLVQLQEWYPAGVGIYASAEVPADLINFFYERLDKVDPAGVRLEAIVSFDETDAFAFEGGVGTAKGFGDSTDASLGGQFAELNIRSLPAFAFAPEPGQDNGDEGFGTLEDNLVGGIFE